MNKYRFDENKHLHTLNGKPLIGTSSAMGIIAKPLTWWASGLAVETLGWSNPRKTSKKDALKTAEEKRLEISKMKTEQYVELLEKAYRKHSEKLTETAGQGTDLHQELEKFVVGQITGEKIKPIEQIKPFVKWCKENKVKFVFSEAHCYSETMWTGGICDAGMILEDKFIIVDFKSSKDAYPSQFLQASGYGIQISENGYFDKDGEKLGESVPFSGVAVVPFGGDCLPKIRYDIYNLVEGFRSAVSLYKIVGRMEGR